MIENGYLVPKEWWRKIIFFIHYYELFIGPEACGDCRRNDCLGCKFRSQPLVSRYEKRGKKKKEALKA